MTDKRNDLGELLKMRRVMMSLTLQELSARTGVSGSHIARIEDGSRNPSARVLRKLAKALVFEEADLLMAAGYLSPQAHTDESETGAGAAGIDPYVAKVLSRETVLMQRTVIAILNILKSLARGV